MSKTTPEEAIEIARKHGGAVLHFDQIMISKQQLAALIDEVIQNTSPTQQEVIDAVRNCHLKLTCNAYVDMKRALDKFVQSRIQKEQQNESINPSGPRSTGDSAEQSGDTSLPIGMAPNEEDEAIRAKELPNIPWTGYLHPATGTDSDT